ncbi:MAG: hypothetical protein ACRELU_03270 [Gemmatimonadota bacterium]
MTVQIASKHCSRAKPLGLAVTTLLLVVPVNVPHKTPRRVNGKVGLCSTGTTKSQISVDVVGLFWMLTELVVNALIPPSFRVQPKPRVTVAAAAVSPPGTPLIVVSFESGAVGPTVAS